MSTESIKAQESEFVDSVSVTEVESIENAKPVKSTTIPPKKEYFALLKLTFDLVKNAKEKDNDKPSVEHIETLREIEMQLNKFHRTFDPQHASLDDGIVLAEIYLKLSEIYRNDYNRKDKLYIAREHLMQCIQLLKGKELDRKVIYTVTRAFYELGHISMKLKDLEESGQFMRKGLELYLTYTEEKDDYAVPIQFAIVNGIETESTYNCTYEMDMLYAHILQMLLLYQYYNVNEYSSTDNCTIMIYMHKILDKLSKTAPLSICYTDWALFSGQLSLELLSQKRFNEARHHLAAASLFTKKFYEEKLMKIDESKFPTERTVAHNKYIEIAIEVAINWAKYGNTLLRSSGERLLYNEGDESATDFAVPPPKLLFADLEDELQNFTVLIKDTYITDYKDAKTVFRRVLKWLEEAKELAAKGKATKKYVDISRGIFHAYKYLACYEREKSEQIKLYKQLMDTLHDFAKSLNADDDDNIRKCIWLQLVLASYFLLEIKTEDLESHDKINTELSAELDKLVKYNIHNSELYLYGNK